MLYAVRGVLVALAFQEVYLSAAATLTLGSSCGGVEVAVGIEVYVGRVRAVILLLTSLVRSFTLLCNLRFSCHRSL